MIFDKEVFLEPETIIGLCVSLVVCCVKLINDSRFALVIFQSYSLKYSTRNGMPCLIFGPVFLRLSRSFDANIYKNRKKFLNRNNTRKEQQKWQVHNWEAGEQEHGAGRRSSVSTRSMERQCTEEVMLAGRKRSKGSRDNGIKTRELFRLLSFARLLLSSSSNRATNLSARVEGTKGCWSFRTFLRELCCNCLYSLNCLVSAAFSLLLGDNSENSRFFQREVRFMYTLRILSRYLLREGLRKSLT